MTSFHFGYLRNLFVFSDNPTSDPFCPILQTAIECLQLGGIICWPNNQEPDIMRLNQSGVDYYKNELLRYTKR